MSVDDAELLRTYVRSNSQEAFGALVHRKLPLVYSAAFRRTNGNTGMAEEITQTVFALLARKAASLQHHPALAGWLFSTTRFVANRALRESRRRERREALMVEVAQTQAADDVSWEELRPVIDDALMELSEADRLAVLLRYFENRTYGEVGAAMNLGESAARMRVGRALESLRRRLAKCGVTSTAAALGATISTHGATAVSPALASAIIQDTAGTGVGGTLLFAMTMSSLKFPAAVAVAIAAFTYGVFEHSGRSSAQHENSELKRNLALLEGRLDSTEAASSVAASPAPTAISTGPQGAPKADPADPATNPEARRLYLAKQIANIRIDTRSYFEALGLSNEQRERYLAALLDGLEVQLDAQALGRAGNLSPREQELAMAESMAKVRRDLVAAIGSEANQGWIEYNRRLALRPLAEELAAKLAFSDHPLTPEQGDAIMDLVQKHGGLRLRGSNWVLPEEALGTASEILLPRQHEVMKEQQAIRRADRELEALKRSR